MAKKQKKVGIDQIHMQNAVKTLAANIRFASVDDPIRSIVVTSSVPNEGKTTVAISLAEAIASSGSSVLLLECDMRRRSIANSLGIHARSGVAISLAEAIASSGSSVLLLECDMRRRSIANSLGIHARSGVYSVLCGQTTLADAMVATGTRGMYFLDSEPMRRRSIANSLGIHARSGVYSVLCGQTTLADAMVATGTRGMYFLDSEPHIPNPDVLLSSKRFRKMVDAALDSFDYVIFDTPPLSAFVDAAVLSTVADGTLLVVGQNVVRRDELASSHAQLEKAGANLIGAVRNLCKSEKSEYYTEYYSRGGDDSNAPAAPVSAPVSQAVAKAASPRPAARKAPRAAGTPRQATPVQSNPAAAQGLKPIPQAGAKVPPDSTAQFIASIQSGSKK